MNRFKDKVALITGAAQGIGRRVAERMAAEGARLILVDRSDRVFEVQKQLAPATQVLALTADLELYTQCTRVMHTAAERFGRLDVLVNNVGGTIWAKPFEHYAPDEIEAEVRRSLFPTLWAVTPYCRTCLSRAAAPSSMSRPSPPAASIACPTARRRAA